MQAIKEYNGAETFYHGVNHRDFDQLVREANGRIEDIVLYGRVFNPEKEFLEAEHDQDYEEVRGEGYVYACDYWNREQATPGASATPGVTLILGWDGVHEDEDIDKNGEWLVPLSSYRVVGTLEE